MLDPLYLMLLTSNGNFMKLLITGLCLFVSSLGMIFFAAANAAPPKGKNVIILLGPPGSGKGTQAKRLSQELGLPHISTGDIFRENIANSTELGKKARSYMDVGQLVPDQLVLEMLFDRVSKSDCVNGYLLDGFPRTIPQAESLDKHLSPQDKIVVLNLDVADETIVKRIEGRLSCTVCGNVYNRYFSPPQVPGKCDKCKSPLVQRSDDSEQVVRERLKAYHEHTEPLTQYYSKKKVLKNIDGEKSPDDVFNDLIANFRLAAR